MSTRWLLYGVCLIGTGVLGQGVSQAKGFWTTVAND